MRARDVKLHDVAEAMGLSVEKLCYYARHTEHLYFPTREEVTGKGKIRKLDVPKPEWKPRFKGLHRFFQAELRPPVYVHGGVKRKSCFTSARVHKHRQYVSTRDVDDCFPSIKTDRLCAELKRSGFREPVAGILSRILTVHGHVPQGCPTSGDAQNFMLANVARQTDCECKAEGIAFGQMCDDILLSGDSKRMLKLMIRKLERRLDRIGLRVSRRKVDDHGIQTSGHHQLIHNLVVNHPRGVAINDGQRRRATEEVESFARAARDASPDSLEELARWRERVVGLRCHSQQADHGPARHLHRIVGHADRHVINALRRARLRAYRNKWWTPGEAARLTRAWRRIARNATSANPGAPNSSY